MSPCNPLKFFMRTQKVLALSSVLTGVAFAAGMSLMASQTQAEERVAEAVGPFQSLAGTWSGTGTISMKDGGHERIRCRGTYAVQSAGNNLQQELRCASDSYKFEMTTNITQSGEQHHRLTRRRDLLLHDRRHEHRDLRFRLRPKHYEPDRQLGVS